MPKKIDPRFGKDDLVGLDPGESPSSDALAGVVDLLAGEFDRQAALRALTEIAAGHCRWRKQALSDVTGSECNEQLRRIVAASGSFATHPLETADEIKVMVWGLSGEAFLALCATPTLRNRPDDQPWSIPALMENLPAVMAAAREAIRPYSGPKSNMSLAIIVAQLVELYENATGKQATHTPYSNDQYTAEPQSVAGHFIKAFFQLVDCQVHPAQLNTVLAREIKNRRSRAAKRQE